MSKGRLHWVTVGVARATVGTDPVSGQGVDARITRHPTGKVVLRRRATDVMDVKGGHCSRDQSIALARAAVAP